MLEEIKLKNFRELKKGIKRSQSVKIFFKSQDKLQ